MNNLLTIEDVIELTHLSRATVYRYVKIGKLPAPAKYANKFLWSEKLIKNWIAEQLGGNAP